MNLWDARRKIAAWKEYNEERPHSSLGYVAPRAYARRMPEAEAARRFRCRMIPCAELGGRSGFADRSGLRSETAPASFDAFLLAMWLMYCRAPGRKTAPGEPVDLGEIGACA